MLPDFCDRQTDGRTPRRWLRRAKHSAFARKVDKSSSIHAKFYCVIITGRVPPHSSRQCRTAVQLNHVAGPLAIMFSLTVAILLIISQKLILILLSLAG